MNACTQFPDIAAENTRAVLRAVRANRHLMLATINGPFRCWQCDTSRAFEVDECAACGEITSAYADRGEA